TASLAELAQQYRPQRGTSSIKRHCPLCLFVALEDEPPAYLNPARLENVGVARRDAEVYVVNVDIWYSEAPTIEKIEEFSAYLEVSRLGNLRLLHEAEILGEEWLRSQTTVSGC